MDIQTLNILASSGLILGVVTLIFKAGRTSEKIDNLQKNVLEIKNDIKDVKNEVSLISTRLGRLEGFLMGPQILRDDITGTEKK